VTNFQAAGLGHPVQWARWGNAQGPNVLGAGCYVYLDSQRTLGVTTELLATGPQCDTLPLPVQVSDTDWMPGVKLRNAAQPGEEYPVVGLGTGGYGNSGSPSPECWWDVCDNGTVAEEAILAWLAMGGRRIDDATSYYHPLASARALKATPVPREEIYYVSKTGPSDALGHDDILKEAQALKDMGIDYVDMLLVHWPTGGANSSDPLCQQDNNPSTYDERGCRLSTWRAMVKLFDNGFARAIGVSNYNETHIREIVEAGLPLPSLTQIPYNPHRHRSHARMFQLCTSLGIAVSGYSPLGLAEDSGISGSGHSWPPSVGAPSLLQEPAVLQIASNHNASAAQVLIAWSLAVGVTVNPRTSNASHMRENLLAWQIPLTPAEVLQLSMLPESTCDVDPTWYECTPTHTACPPQCCAKPPCPADESGNCCASGGQ
jgi:diketogulonate reductase-like aldo/keto reductase